MQISYHAQFIPLKLSGNGLEGFGGLWCLDSPLLGWALVNNPCPLLDLVPTCALYHVVFISGSQNKDFCPRKLLLYPRMALFSSHILLLLTACYYQRSLVGCTAIWLFIFETQTLAPSLWGFYTSANLASVRKGGWKIFIINGYEDLRREKMKLNSWSANHILKKNLYC